MPALELLSAAEMRQADQLAAAAGIPAYELMEKAGAAVADAIIARHAPQPTLILCGPGNNGGDGLVVARILAAGRWPVRVALACDPAALQGDAARAAAWWSGPLEPLSPALLEGKTLIVDALFGSGLSRTISWRDAREMIEAVNSRGHRCCRH